LRTRTKKMIGLAAVVAIISIGYWCYNLYLDNLYGTKVSIQELIAHPEAYVGQRVRVTGFLDEATSKDKVETRAGLYQDFDLPFVGSFTFTIVEPKHEMARFFDLRTEKPTSTRPAYCIVTPTSWQYASSWSVAQQIAKRDGSIPQTYTHADWSYEQVGDKNSINVDLIGPGTAYAGYLGKNEVSGRWQRIDGDDGKPYYHLVVRPNSKLPPIRRE